MSEAFNPLEWAKYAEEDWEVANLLIKRKRIRTMSICFHAQQSAEKYLKALLVSKKTAFPKTHDLSTLNSLCSQIGIFTEFSPVTLAILTDHAVSSRYPGAEPSVEDAKESIIIAKSIRKFARSFLGIWQGKNAVLVGLVERDVALVERGSWKCSVIALNQIPYFVGITIAKRDRDFLPRRNEEHENF